MPTRFPLNFQEVRAMELFVLSVIREELDNRINPITGSLPLPTGYMDKNNTAGRIDGILRDYGTVDGINDPARGDGVLGAAGDAGNGAGASFFLGHTLGMAHRTKGSAHGYSVGAYITSDTPDYGEFGMLVGRLEINRLGAYGAAAELHVVPSQPSRAAGIVIAMGPNFSTAALAAALADGINPRSSYAQTGTRSFHSQSSTGLNGTGLFLEGNHDYGILARYPTMTQKVLGTFTDQFEDFPHFAIDARGVLEWRDPAVDAASDCVVQRMGAATPGTPNNWRVNGVISGGAGVALTNNGGGVTVISPDGLTTKTIGIDNAGAIIAV